MTTTGCGTNRYWHCWPGGPISPARTGRTRRIAASRWPARARAGRLELTPVGADADSRYKKIVAHIEQLQDAPVEIFIRLKAKQEVPTELDIDFDATDDPILGDQLGKFFHGYDKNYCFLPLYAFCDDWPLAAILRPSNIDTSAGTVDQLARIVPRLRAAWPDVRIIVRGDSGLCRESIMRWCEENNVDFLFGLAQNKRLLRLLGKNCTRPKSSSGKPLRRPACSRTSLIARRRVGLASGGLSARQST